MTSMAPRLPRPPPVAPAVRRSTLSFPSSQLHFVVTVAPFGSCRDIVRPSVKSCIDWPPPTALIVVAKPLGLQTHKGGQELAPGESGAVCLESWLTGHIDLGACSDAAQVP